MHESYVYDEVAKSKMVVCTYLCKHIRILNIYRNINDILHFGVLFVICLFFLVAHFVSYLLFRMLASLFYCFNTANNISSFPLSCYDIIIYPLHILFHHLWVIS